MLVVGSQDQRSGPIAFHALVRVPFDGGLKESPCLLNITHRSPNRELLHSKLKGKSKKLPCYYCPPLGHMSCSRGFL